MKEIPYSMEIFRLSTKNHIPISIKSLDPGQTLENLKPDYYAKMTGLSGEISISLVLRGRLLRWGELGIYTII